MPRNGDKPEKATNHRNGTSGKTVLTDDGPLALEVLRDRAGTFEPRHTPNLGLKFGYVPSSIWNLELGVWN
ncbi:hypothetical protein BH24ACI5_BH24ACI5_03030 [soil metagenome]